MPVESVNEANRPRPSPRQIVTISEELQSLIFEAYPAKEAVDLIANIERYLGILNRQSRTMDALYFLIQSETGVRNHIQSQKKERSRNTLKLIANNNVVSTSLLALIKYLLKKYWPF